MALTADEDLRLRTIEKLKGELRRLAYLAALRRGNREYRHWGLAHQYGTEAANDACMKAHEEALAQVLNRELADLLSQVVNEKGTRELMSLLAKDVAIPTSLDAASARHYRRTVRALSLLLSAPEDV